MRSRMISVMLFGMLLLLCGCLEFEEQSMAYRYDEKSDTLYIFQEYRGIFGGDKKDGLSKEEMDQLSSVLSTQRTFFFANWIFEYDRERLLDYGKELDDPQKRKDSGWKEGDEGYNKVQNLMQLLTANVTVVNGPFFYDAKHHLCGVQKVKVTHASEIIRVANGVLAHVVSNPPPEGMNAEQKRVYLKAAKRRKEFIHLQKNVLSFVWPMTKEEYDRSFGEGGDEQPQLASFKQHGGRVELVDDEFRVSIGNANDVITTMEMPVAKAEKDFKGYPANVEAEVKKKTVILDKFDVAAARNEFLNSGK